MDLADILAVVAVVLAGLGCGIFFTFSTGVMPGLRRSDDRTFVTAMRGINRAVVNPAFLLPIFLSPVALGVAGVVALVTARAGTAGAASGWLLVAAAAVALVGAVLVTGARNIPLNNALDASTAPDAAARAAFERPWNAANTIRTLLTLAAFVLGVVALAL